MYGITRTSYQQGEVKVDRKLYVVLLTKGCLCYFTPRWSPVTNYDITKSEKNNKLFGEKELEGVFDLGLFLD